MTAGRAFFIFLRAIRNRHSIPAHLPVFFEYVSNPACT
jgi:hypothetical protein